MAGHLGDVQRTIAEPGGRAHRRRAPAAAGQGLGARATAGRDIVVRPAARARRPQREAGRQKPRRRSRGEADHGTETHQRQGRQAGHGGREGRDFRARVQRGAGAPDRDRLPGERAPRHARAEGPRRRAPLDQEALAPEGHRPRARRHDLEPAVARRRQDLPELAGRELLAEGEPQDVPRRHGVDPVAARARGPPPRGRRVQGRRAQDQAARAEGEVDGPRRGAGHHRRGGREPVRCRRATCRTSR